MNYSESICIGCRIVNTSARSYLRTFTKYGRIELFKITMALMFPIIQFKGPLTVGCSYNCVYKERGHHWKHNIIFGVIVRCFCISHICIMAMLRTMINQIADQFVLRSIYLPRIRYNFIWVRSFIKRRLSYSKCSVRLSFIIGYKNHCSFTLVQIKKWMFIIKIRIIFH